MSMNIWKAITARFLADSRRAEDVEAHRVLSDIVRTFETGEGGVLSLPTHEPCGFERARGALRLRDLARDAIIPSCGVVGHAPDCECATL